MKWSEKQERQLLGRINGDKPPGTWKLFCVSLVVAVAWVVVIISPPSRW